MDEWKDFSLRNGRKFNILETMRFVHVILLSLFISSSSFAQNTQIAQTPQVNSTVTIDVKTVQIVLNDEHRGGVDWEAIVTDFHSLQLRKDNDPSWADPKYKLSVGEVSNEDYEVLLDALDTVGRVTQTDFPHVDIDKDQIKTIEASPDPKSFPDINLDLKWFNTASGETKLQINSLVGVGFKENNQATTKQILKNQTEVNLVDNTTIVIGGLIREDEITKTHKFPLLGNLPFVGLVFRKQGKLMQKTETMVFLKIHTGAVQMPAEEQK